MKEEKIIEKLRNDRSMEVFGRIEDLLTIDEQKLLDKYMLIPDKNVDRPSLTDYGDEVIINNFGTVMRDPKTGMTYKISVPYTKGKPSYPIATINNHIQAVYKVVARAFCEKPNTDAKLEIDHVDGDKTNSWCGNLEWVTHKINIKRAYDNKQKFVPSGEDHWEAKYSNKQIELCCQLLMTHPEYAYKRIEEITGVNWQIVQDLYLKRKHLAIAGKYTFPPRETQVHLRGEANGNSRHTEQQVRTVCAILSDPECQDWSTAKIAEVTGVSRDSIMRIMKGKLWAEVGNEYEFLPRIVSKAPGAYTKANPKYTVETIEKVCNRLDDVALGKSKDSYRTIAEDLGLSKQVVADIAHGKTWKHVSCTHTFYTMKFNN